MTSDDSDFQQPANSAPPEGGAKASTERGPKGSSSGGGDLAALIKKQRKALAVLCGLLVITVVAGFFLQKSFFNGAAASDVDLNALLSLELRQYPGSAYPIEFQGTRVFPAGAGLSGWLEGYPFPDKISSVEAPFIAMYSLEGSGDWDLSFNPAGLLIARVPLPEFKGLRYTPEYIILKTSSDLAPADKKLATDMLDEKIMALLRQEESARRASRLEEVREKVRAFISQVLVNHRVSPPSSFEVRFSEESGDEEQGADDDL